MNLKFLISNRIIIFFIFFTIHYSLFTIHCLNAQQTKYNEVVKIVGDYTPTISDAFKINLTPKLPDTVIKAPNLNYSINSKKFSTNFEVEQIKPAKLIGEPLDPLYNSLFKVGIGNYYTPYAEFYYNTLRSKEYSAGIHLKHLSSHEKDGTITPFDDSKYSDNEIDLYGKMLKGENIYFGDFNYSRYAYHYYGYNPAITNNDLLSPENKQQHFSYFSIDAGLKNNSVYSRLLNYELMFKFSDITDNYNASENNLNLIGSVSKDVKFISAAKSQKLIIEANLDYFFDSYNDKFGNPFTDNDGVVKFVPKLASDFGALRLNLGFNLSFFDPTVKFYPLADAELKLINDILYIYAGIKGEAIRNNLKMFTNENPFINTTPYYDPYMFTNNKFEFFGGVKGNFNKYVNYNISLSASKLDNLPLFVSDTNKVGNLSLENKFEVIYDNVQVLKLKAEVNFQQSEKLAILLGASYYSYKLDRELKAWEKPGFDLSISANYKLNNKINLRAAIIGLYQTYARTFSPNSLLPTPYKLKDIYDINLGADYNFTKRIYAFLNLNNIAFQKYERWYNYPSQKLNLILGAGFSF